MQLLDTSLSITLADEFVMRSGLRVFLDQWFENRRLGDDTPVREGRRMRWLDQALAPLQNRLPPAELRRLHAALALTLSIEPVTIMHDVCHIDDDAEILAILRWARPLCHHREGPGSIGHDGAVSRAPKRRSERSQEDHAGVQEVP